MKVRSNNGLVVDMARLAAENETVMAAGNAHMNARGDIVRNGVVVKKREDIAAEYHRANVKTVKSVSLKELADEPIIVENPAPTAPEQKFSPSAALAEVEQTVGFSDPAAALAATRKSARKIVDAKE